MAKLIAEDLGVTLELKPITSKQRIPFLTSGTVDLLVSSMGANPERAKSVWFSSANAPFFSGAFAAPEIKVSSPEDLAGLKAGVTGGTIEDLELPDLPSL
ncbi:transporter substrate-binding domain-containing protein [Epibacterium ulvae]|uniref:transporter substrate-binding domain-containing protein n=1 Tax=Epibacterium ulvae TaxID=1156985 RepID=UPI0024938904|nr:transporter substrate-binding domain-containing protein [Epibacterium ulvae]